MAESPSRLSAATHGGRRWITHVDGARRRARRSEHAAGSLASLGYRLAVPVRLPVWRRRCLL